MTARPQQLLEGASHETLGSDIAPNSDVHENRRLKTTDGFDGIDCFDKLGLALPQP
jgi:hypothetical protein